MKLVVKLDQSLDRFDLARPPPEQNIVLPRVIISCQKLKNVADQIGDLVIGVPFLSMEDSALVASLLRQGCTHLGNALAAAMYDPDGDSEEVLEYLVTSSISLFSLKGMSNQTAPLQLFAWGFWFLEAPLPLLFVYCSLPLDFDVC